MTVANGTRPARLERLRTFLPTYLHAAASSVYLFTVGAGSRRNRVLLHLISKHFREPRESSALYFEYARRFHTMLPSIEAGKILARQLRVALDDPVPVDGGVALTELLILAGLVQARRPAALFEFGTFNGATTLNLAINAPAHARVYTLDLPKNPGERGALGMDAGDLQFIEKADPGGSYRGTDVEPKITQLYGDSASFDFRPFHNSVDFIFVDASHAYDYVLSDSRNALALLRHGRGAILWHDYGSWPGVTKALDLLHRTDERFSELCHLSGTSLACLIRD